MGKLDVESEHFVHVFILNSFKYWYKIYTEIIVKHTELIVIQLHNKQT